MAFYSLTTYLNEACCILSLFILLNHLIIVLVSCFSLPCTVVKTLLLALSSMFIFMISHWITTQRIINSSVSVSSWSSAAVQTRLLIIASLQKTIFRSLILRCYTEKLILRQIDQIDDHGVLLTALCCADRHG